MSKTWRLVKDLVGRAAQTAMGRRNMIRLGSFLNNRGRFESYNDIVRNGELMVRDVVLSCAGDAQPLQVFDVGANFGDWTIPWLDGCRERGRDNFELHAFEPCSSTFDALTARVQRHELASQVRLVRKAVSTEPGPLVLHVLADRPGENSLYSRDYADFSGAETVEVVRIDDYCRARGIDDLTLVKIDAEGHDFNVIESLGDLLRSRRVGIVQFEYNWPWVHARRFLRDVFVLAEEIGYRIGKVTPAAIEFYSRWHFELETFHESNFVICTPEWAARFPSIPWWRS